MNKAGLSLVLRTVNLTARRQLHASNLVRQSAAGQSQSSGTIPPPNIDGQPKAYSPKIQTLVDQIAQLNLLEVADLNELLRKKLNIKDVAVS